MKRLSESVWGNIRKKSLGQEGRLENGVNHLTPKGLYDYIMSNYKGWSGFPLKKSVSINPSENVIEVDVYESMHEKGGGFKLVFELDNDNINVKLMPDGLRSSLKEVDIWLLNGLKKFAEVKRFDKERLYNSYFLISPYDCEETTNEFFLSVLNYLIDAKKDSIKDYLKVKKKSKV